MDNFIPLDSIHVAAPCSADWDAMQGDSRTRFCGTCAKNVYNLSDMSRAQAQALVDEKEGKLCVQFYRRSDGTMITDDCPVPLRPARNGALRAWRTLTAGAMTIAALCGGWVTRVSVAAPKLPVTKRAVATSHAKKIQKKKVQAHRTTGSPLVKTRGSKPLAMPKQTALTGMVAPLPMRAIPKKPVVVMHPDNAPGKVGGAVRGEPRTKVIQVPSPAVAETAAPVRVPAIMGQTVASPAPAPVPPAGDEPVRIMGGPIALPRTAPLLQPVQPVPAAPEPGQ